jgi:predicted metal-dependent phosphoesterase TrpH
MTNKLQYQTLHSHTTSSDGLLTHTQVLDVCSKNNIGVVAFTDHDTLPNEKTVKILEKNRDRLTKWIIGIELSASLPENIKGRASPHIVGLFVDPFNKDLLEHSSKAQEARIQREKLTVKNLQSLGFKITNKDVLKVAAGATVGRPHLVAALKSKRVNLKLIEKIRQKMKKDAEKDPGIKEKYDEMMKKGENQYPYVLFLSRDAYIPQVYVEYLYKINWNKAVEAVRGAGGITLLAHWFTEKKVITEEVLEELLRESKIDGVETICGLWTGGAFSKKEINKDWKILRNLIKKHKKLEGGGLDAHKREDFELFARETWYSEKTIGLAENIIKKSNVDLKNSSILPT